MEACGSAHYWGREIETLGHEVRLVPPIYVKPFVKRQKTTVRTRRRSRKRRRAMLFRSRDLLVRQRTQTINALRGHLAEFGVVDPQATTQIS